MTKKKKQGKSEFAFKINAVSIDAIPMSRLASYMCDVASILGEHKHVHFVRLTKGSTVLNIMVDNDAVPRVLDRVRGSSTDCALGEVKTAVRNLNHRLAEDGTSGVLIGPNKEDVIPFPGKDTLVSPAVGPVREAGTLDGVPIRVGGRKPVVPVHLQGLEENFYRCVASRDIAKQIAQFLFQTTLRVTGVGQWIRSPQGEWEMESFKIHEFKEMGDISLPESVQRLRAIKLDLDDEEDFLETLGEIRRG